MKKHFGLIGYPLTHTMSPFIQARLFEVNGIDADYSLYSFPVEEFPKYIDTLKKLDGFNITIPHKQNVIKYLASMDAAATRFGAVNTVKTENGSLSGFNTDAYGYLSGLEFNNIPLKGNVLMYGYGGVARTIAFETLRMGCSLTICTRQGSRERALPLTQELKKATGITVPVIEVNEISKKYDLFVNATPIGMYPSCDASPLTKEQVALMGNVFDTIYNPLETLVLKYARQQGIPCANGLAMLVCQAAQAQTIWCGVQFSREQLERVVTLTAQELMKK